jgi:hypothetical protein
MNLDPIVVAKEAREVWRSIPAGPMIAWQGTPMSAREARFRIQHIEPFVRAAYLAKDEYGFDGETVRAAIDAAMSPIPGRRRARTSMTIAEAIEYLHEQGAIANFGNVRELAAEYGITIIDDPASIQADE